MGDIITGIKTDELLDKRPLPYGFQVKWINWDSPFRKTDLRIGDIIVGLDGKPYLEENRRLEGPRAVGNYHESMHWEQIGAEVGQSITLDIVREEEQLEISGELMAYPFYYTDNQRRAIAPKGPDKMMRDKFDSSWSGWM